jgi:hypothetical protein
MKILIDEKDVEHIFAEWLRRHNATPVNERMRESDETWPSASAKLFMHIAVEVAA